MEAGLNTHKNTLVAQKRENEPGCDMRLHTACHTHGMGEGLGDPTRGWYTYLQIVSLQEGRWRFSVELVLWHLRTLQESAER